MISGKLLFYPPAPRSKLQGHAPAFQPGKITYDFPKCKFLSITTKEPACQEELPGRPAWKNDQVGTIFRNEPASCQKRGRHLYRLQNVGTLFALEVHFSLVHSHDLACQIEGQIPVILPHDIGRSGAIIRGFTHKKNRNISADILQNSQKLFIRNAIFA